MYDIRPLEIEWKKYKAKQRRPLYIVLFSILLILVIFFTFNMSKFNFSVIKESLDDLKSSTQSVENKPEQYILLNKGLLSLETKMTSIKQEVKFDNVLVDIPILDIIKEKENVSQNNNRIHLDIVDTSSISAYEDVEKRFLQSHDIDDALFLARSYYKRLDYDKALYWAFEVNKIDADLEETVLIFIDSKVKLGQKNEAIVLLKNYINKSNSEAGKVLLDNIENDKFL